MRVRSRVGVLLLVLVALHLVVPALAVAADSEFGEYIVDYSRVAGGLKTLLDYGCRVLRVFKHFELALVECPRSAEKLNIDAFAPNGEVSVAAVKLRVYGGLESLGSYGEGYTTAWSWAVSRVGADVAWSYAGLTGEGLVVAVLDTGVDPEHPLLAGKLVTVDPGDPTYPGGWIEFDRYGRPMCTRPQDRVGHGTWVSSILVGGDTTTYIFGVAPRARLMVASVLPGGFGTFAQVLAGLEWVLAPYDCRGRPVGVPRPVVISMSFGALGNYSNILVPAIRRLIEAGIVPVAAIGNGGPYITSNPGNIWGVIGVGATDVGDNVAYFSSYEVVEWPSPPGDWPFKGRYPKTYRKPDVVAPGVEVVGAYPGALLAIGSGTSASAPLVAGIAALIAGELRKAGLSGVRLVEAVYDVLSATAARLDHPGSGYGRVRAYLAVSKALNRSVGEVAISVSPTRVRPGEQVRVLLGVAPGRHVDVYISGIRVFYGPYTIGGITVTIPYTHIGGNTLVALSREGDLYAETLVYANPRLIVEGNMTSGEVHNIIITGLGIGDQVAVYVSGNILTLDNCDLRGTMNVRFLAPYVVSPRPLSITVIDLSIPGVYLTTVVDVIPPAVAIREMVERVEIPVNVRSYYVVGKPDTLEILLPDVNANVSVKQVYPEALVVDVLGVVRVGRLARVTLNITTYPEGGVVFLEISVCVPGSCSSVLSSLNVILEEPLEPLAKSLDSLVKALTEVRRMVELNREDLARLNGTVRSLTASAETLLRDLELLRGSLARVEIIATSSSEKVKLLEAKISELVALEPRLTRLEGTAEDLVRGYEDISTAARNYFNLTVVAMLLSCVSTAIALVALGRALRAALRLRASP